MPEFDLNQLSNTLGNVTREFFYEALENITQNLSAYSTEDLINFRESSREKIDDIFYNEMDAYIDETDDLFKELIPLNELLIKTGIYSDNTVKKLKTLNDKFKEELGDEAPKTEINYEKPKTGNKDAKIFIDGLTALINMFTKESYMNRIDEAIKLEDEIKERFDNSMTLLGKIDTYVILASLAGY